MPLLVAPINVSLVVKRIFADEKIKRHLESIGITLNSTITVLDNVKGNLVVKVKDVRLALDRDVAGKIFVF